jgi:hypothetical protein
LSGWNYDREAFGKPGRPAIDSVTMVFCRRDFPRHVIQAKAETGDLAMTSWVEGTLLS